MSERADVFRMLREIPEIGAEHGDFLVRRNGHRRSFVLHRDLSPEQTALLDEWGAVSLVDPQNENGSKKQSPQVEDSLDQWLDQLNGGKLSCGPKPPIERWGGSLLDDNGKERLREHKKRTNFLPRVCRTCRREFTPDRARVVRCPDCRASRANG